MAIRSQIVSIKGKQRSFPAIQIEPGTVIVVRGKLPKIGEIYDELWLESKRVPHAKEIVEELSVSSLKPDLFSFAERLPEVSPKNPYFFEWDNLAVCSFSSYAEWFDKKINRGARKAIRQSIKDGVRTDVVPFDDALLEGISSIYNECPVRQGRKFWHLGKSVATLKDEHSTYLERSIFAGAFYRGELVGFIKMVVDDSVAHFMQIISKVKFYDKRVTNSLLSAAVEICESRGIKYLTYGQFDYGNKGKSSLAEFKRHNGFERVEIPRYYVPLSPLGQVVLKLKLHKGVKSWVPEVFWQLGSRLRENWYNLRTR